VVISAGAEGVAAAVAVGPNVIWDGEYLEKYPFSFAGNSKKRWFQVTAPRRLFSVSWRRHGGSDADAWSWGVCIAY
jgi:hypothetical protein